jgi:hypothetical protein
LLLLSANAHSVPPPSQLGVLLRSSYLPKGRAHAEPTAVPRLVGLRAITGAIAWLRQHRCSSRQQAVNKNNDMNSR